MHEKAVAGYGVPTVPLGSAAKMIAVGAGVVLGEGLVPVPLSAAVCGLPAALSATLTLALRAPAAVGVNVTLMPQLLPAVNVPPHVVVRVKSPGLLPVMVMLEIVSVAPPVFVSVMVCGDVLTPTSELPNARLVGESDAPDVVPVPVSGAV